MSFRIMVTESLSPFNRDYPGCHTKLFVLAPRTDFRNKCWTGSPACAFPYYTPIPGIYQCKYVWYPSPRIKVDLGKGTREELDDEEGREIGRKMREVVDRELKEEEKPEKSKL